MYILSLTGQVLGPVAAILNFDQFRHVPPNEILSTDTCGLWYFLRLFHFFCNLFEVRPSFGLIWLDYYIHNLDNPSELILCCENRYEPKPIGLSLSKPIFILTQSLKNINRSTILFVLLYAFLTNICFRY